jgi:two-component system invasion response regulator UvrY
VNDKHAEDSKTEKQKTSGQAEMLATPQAATLQVVLVDDSLPMRERLVASLVALDGVEIIGQANDVPSGLRLLETRPPDVLVLDVELPGQSGMDLLKIAHRRKFAPVIIMFSIYDHPKLRQLCLNNGATHYFHKLTQFDDIADLCRELAVKKRQQTG